MAEQTTQIANGRAEALEKAMLLFWERGAEVASYNELVEATGLSRKALYRFWPDKDAMVRDSLDYYRKNLLAPVFEPLAKGGRKGLRAFWLGLEAATRAKSWRGCYLYRTAGGPLRGHTYVIDHLNAYLDELAGAFATQIAAGQATGEIDTDINAELAGLQAVSVIGMMSAVGASEGYNGRVRKLFAAGRQSCGLTA